MSARDFRLTISWFDSAILEGRPALGDSEQTTWGAFCEVFTTRREGDKDGCCFSPSLYRLEPDGRHVRRKLMNVIARTAVTLDVDPNKKTGEVPPDPSEALRRAAALGFACLVYTSHSHRAPSNIRYRVVLPLSDQVAPEIPAPEIVARLLGLDGVLDASKVNAAAVFYCPSCQDEDDKHYCETIDGQPLDAVWILQEGAGILEVEQNAAQEAAAARLAVRSARGFDDEDSLIEKIRPRLDLESILLSHGYEKSGGKFKHPNSTSGSFGANIKVLGGVERVFSHNATDPLHASNLPQWCKPITAIDAFDVTTILDYSGDRKKALRAFSQKFNLDKAAEKKLLAKRLFQLIRHRLARDEIETVAFAEGRQIGLSDSEIIQVALWVDERRTFRSAA